MSQQFTPEIQWYFNGFWASGGFGGVISNSEAQDMINHQGFSGSVKKNQNGTYSVNEETDGGHVGVSGTLTEEEVMVAQ